MLRAFGNLSLNKFFHSLKEKKRKNIEMKEEIVSELG